MITDFKTNERRFLILENEHCYNLRTTRFVNCVTCLADGLPVESGEVISLFGVQHRMDEEIAEAIKEVDCVVFESTFLDGAQVERMIKIFSEIKESKDIISIHTDLPYSVPKGCEHHRVFLCPDGYPHKLYEVK